MDREQRQQIIESIEEGTLRKQREHISRVEKLETEFGANLDILTEIYGAWFLDNNPGSVDIIGKIEDVHQRVALGDQYLCVGGIKKVLRPGCYGFGAKEVYDKKFIGCFMDRNQGDLQLNYTNKDDEGPRVSLSGSGYVIMPEKELPASSSEVTFVISGMDEILPSIPFSYMDVIKSADSKLGVAYEVLDASHMAGRFVNLGLWPLDWARNELEASV